MRIVAAAVIMVILAAPARGQYKGLADAHWVNHRLSGQIVDYTHNHIGHDNRIFSQILDQPRDMYVYLPPGYDPHKAYPLLLYFHIARVDEHEFIGSGRLIELDRMITAGEFPPAIVVCPDGMIDGLNRFMGDHSFYVNGVNGRFGDHIVSEVIPFVTSHYSIRPERAAHAILGLSGGGYGGLSMAIRYKSYFGAVATLAAPVNLLYDNCHGDVLEDFDPSTFRWRSDYNPDEIIGRFYCGLKQVKARKYVEPIFGGGDDVAAKIRTTNPASLVADGALAPGELAIYLHYAGQDGYNFDAHSKSFAWLAAQRGIAVTLQADEQADHTIAYFRRNQKLAYQWLSHHLLGPTP